MHDVYCVCKCVERCVVGVLLCIPLIHAWQVVYVYVRWALCGFWCVRKLMSCAQQVVLVLAVNRRTFCPPFLFWSRKRTMETMAKLPGQTWRVTTLRPKWGWRWSMSRRWQGWEGSLVHPRAHHSRMSAMCGICVCTVLCMYLFDVCKVFRFQSVMYRIHNCQIVDCQFVQCYVDSTQIVKLCVVQCHVDNSDSSL